MGDRADDPPPPDSKPIVQTRYSSAHPASESIIRALAAVEGVKPTELDVLYDVIDPEALDTLLGNPTVTGGENTTTVTFFSSGYRVIVSSDGTIAIFEDEPAA